MTDPFSSETSGYHLFLEPKGPAGEKLQEIISDLAREHGGPAFPPHVTLLAEIPKEREEALIEKAERLAAWLSPVTLTLRGLAMEDRYFRALYALVEDSEELRAYRAQALEIFSIAADEEYLPHLSLLYGNYPEERKQESSAIIILPQERSFVVDSLSLYETEGGAEAWKKVREFGLGGREN